MHRAFAEAVTAQDIGDAITRMENDAAISDGEAAALRGLVAEALEDPRVREWFGPHVQVRNENDIVLPSSAQVRRPDRVMIDGTRATIVDYKFGMQKAASHLRQIKQYAELLVQMGYKHVEAYLWYVSLGEIERAEL